MCVGWGGEGVLFFEANKKSGKVRGGIWGQVHDPVFYFISSLTAPSSKSINFISAKVAGLGFGFYSCWRLAGVIALVAPLLFLGLYRSKF